MNATEQYLFSVGGVLEFAGIMAVAWPDLLPYGERLSAWLGRAYRSAYQRTADLMRQFSRRPRGVIVQAPAATLTPPRARRHGKGNRPAGRNLR